MDYDLLLDLATDLGYELAMCGAETFRVEESVNRVLAAYGISAETFAIPNCLIVSIDCNGHPMTRMRRIGFHGNDLDSVERFSALSRRICAETPAPETAAAWLQEIRQSPRKYRLPAYLLGNFIGACGFCIFYGGTFSDGLCAGICGILVGLIVLLMDTLKANQFFRTLAAAFPMAFLAYGLHAAGICGNPDMTVIGALMILVPGLLFTNAMRDIIYGDTNSGINRIVQVFLIAVAIAIGTAAAMNLSTMLWGAPIGIAAEPMAFPLRAFICLISCFGFVILFNIHGPGGLICALGGMITWIVYSVTLHFTGGDIIAFFWGTIFAAVYAEAMARIRKYPAISYLVVSLFPLIPGAGVYYTMNYAMQGQMDLFVNQGLHTLAIAGIMAVAILLVSTSVRILAPRLRKRTKPS